MKRYRTLAIPILSLLICFNAQAAELVLNGDFESGFYSPGSPNFWKANSGDGNDNLQDTTHCSPFLNVYPAGGHSVVLIDGASDSGFPNLGQSFGSVSQFSLSFDFCLGSVSLDAPWRFTIGSDANHPNLDFLIGGSIAAVHSFIVSGGTIGAEIVLNPSTWYQLNATFDDKAKTYAGSLTAYGGASVFFSGSLFAAGPSTTSSIKILDASSSQNPALNIDNISVQPVPEPSVSAIVLCTIILFTASRASTRAFRWS